MFRFRQKGDIASYLRGSKLFDERSFYTVFTDDLRNCREQAIIESPFITSRRVKSLLPTLRKLRQQGVNVIINTRDPKEHDEPWRLQAIEAIGRLQELGVTVLYTGGHHRKLAILDERILWEGSLNILSQSASCEIMRRTESKEMAQQMITFTKLNEFV